MADLGTLVQDNVVVRTGPADLPGILLRPPSTRSLVIFAHGSGSSRHSRRNQYVAEQLYQAGMAALLFDLLTASEARIDAQTAHLRFDIDLLAQRLIAAIDWAEHHERTESFAIGLFGASTGAAAALVAAAERPDRVRALVSRGGRPDLAGDALGRVQAPTMFIVGSRDTPVIQLNREAASVLRATNRLEIVPGASHLFEEPGALEQVSTLAISWFEHYVVSTGY